MRTLKFEATCCGEGYLRLFEDDKQIDYIGLFEDEAEPFHQFKTLDYPTFIRGERLFSPKIVGWVRHAYEKIDLTN